MQNTYHCHNPCLNQDVPTHYLQLIEAITFYHQYQRDQKVNEDTGEIYIETITKDIQEANNLITEVLLRKSDTLTGACRNHLENLKNYLAKNNTTTFTNAEIRRNLRIKETHLETTTNNYYWKIILPRSREKKGQNYHYQINDINEYKNLKAEIDKALNTCLDQVNLASS